MLLAVKRWANRCLPDPPSSTPEPRGRRRSEVVLLLASWRRLVGRLLRSERASAFVEYALLIALVAVGLIAILHVTRNAIGGILNTASTSVSQGSAGYGAGPGGPINLGPPSTAPAADDEGDEPSDSSAADSTETD
jgi:Flp pilus assembly pilin Flp